MVTSGLDTITDHRWPIEREDLEAAIRDAFADVPAPADTEIVGCPGDYEADDAHQRVAGKTWSQLLQELQHLEDTDLYSFHFVYPFLTPMAFHYYLPAFLIVSLDPVRADTVCEYLFIQLAPEPDATGGNPEWFAAFTVRMTSAQREAIRRSILYVNDLCDELGIGNVTEEESLRHFWFPEGFPRAGCENRQFAMTPARAPG